MEVSANDSFPCVDYQLKLEGSVSRVVDDRQSECQDSTFPITTESSNQGEHHQIHHSQYPERNEATHPGREPGNPHFLVLHVSRILISGKNNASGLLFREWLLKCWMLEI